MKSPKDTCVPTLRDVWLYQGLHSKSLHSSCPLSCAGMLLLRVEKVGSEHPQPCGFPSHALRSFSRCQSLLAPLQSRNPYSDLFQMLSNLRCPAQHEKYFPKAYQPLEKRVFLSPLANPQHRTGNMQVFHHLCLNTGCTATSRERILAGKSMEVMQSLTCCGRMDASKGHCSSSSWEMCLQENLPDLSETLRWGRASRM